MSTSNFPLDCVEWRQEQARKAELERVRQKARNRRSKFQLHLRTVEPLAPENESESESCTCEACGYRLSVAWAAASEVAWRNHFKQLADFAQAQIDALDASGDYKLSRTEVRQALEQIKMLAESDPEW